MLKTEMRDVRSTHMDKMEPEELSSLLVTAQYEAVKACEEAVPAIAQAVDAITEAFEGGHRLFYIGAGSSGRLGVLDASECPPTFGADPQQVQGIIAGGKEMMFRASEDAEDHYENGVAAMVEYGVAPGDVVVGISAAGGASYVIGALEWAKAHGCVTVGLCCNPGAPILALADIAILTDTGSEMLTGSTRMKAGTAQKIVLNTLSTAAMVRTGRVYENMMINLKPTNTKLRQRVIRITAAILECDEATAEKQLEQNEWNIRKAVTKG